MPTVLQYANQLQDRRVVIARKLGININPDDGGQRARAMVWLILLAVIIKTLVDNGVITDAQLLATLNGARDDGYDVEAVLPDPPSGAT